MLEGLCSRTSSLLSNAGGSLLGIVGALFLPSLFGERLHAENELALGEVETFLELPTGQHPEGITFDRDGNLYFGNRFLVIQDGVPGFLSELRKITPDNQSDTVIATFAFASLLDEDNGILGLAADNDGNVWAAVDGGDDNGVWRVSGNGNRKIRIAGSENMGFPNAITFDSKGNLYVTNSGPVGCGLEACPVGGAIWRLPRGGTTLELWIEDPALAPFTFDLFEGFHLPGANGIAFFPPNSLYVANTEKGQILRVGIAEDGSAQAVEAITAPFDTPTADGIAVDFEGNVHAVLPTHAVVGGFPPMVKVDTITGEVTRTTLPIFDNVFDIPLSLAFDTIPGERTTVYSANGDLPGTPAEIDAGPSILRANVGVKGAP